MAGMEEDVREESLERWLNTDELRGGLGLSSPAALYLTFPDVNRGARGASGAGALEIMQENEAPEVLPPQTQPHRWSQDPAAGCCGCNMYP